MPSDIAAVKQPVQSVAVVASNLHTILSTGKYPDNLVNKTKEAFAEHLQAADKFCDDYMRHMNQARSLRGAATNDRPAFVQAARKGIVAWDDAFNFLNKLEFRHHELTKELAHDPAIKRIKNLANILAISRMSNYPLPVRALEQLSIEDQKLDDVERRRLVKWVHRIHLTRKGWVDINTFHKGLESLIEIFNTSTAPTRKDFSLQKSDLGILEYRLLKDFKCKILEHPDPLHLIEIDQVSEGNDYDIDGKTTRLGKRTDVHMQLIYSSDTAIFPILGIAGETKPSSELGNVNFGVNSARPYIDYGDRKLNNTSPIPTIGLMPHRIKWHSNSEHSSCSIMPGNIKYLDDVQWKTQKSAEENKNTPIDEADRPLIRALAVFVGQRLLNNDTPLDLVAGNFVYDSNDHHIKARNPCKMGPADPKALRAFLHTIARKNPDVEKELVEMSCVAKHPYEGAFYSTVLKTTFEVLTEVEAEKRQPTPIEKIIEETGSNPNVHDGGIALREAAKQLHQKCELEIMDHYEVSNVQRLPAKKAIGPAIYKLYQANGFVGSLNFLDTPQGFSIIAAAVAQELGLGHKQDKNK